MHDKAGSAAPPSAKEISAGALSGSDPTAVEAVDMLLAIVGAEAGAMALRCLAKGGVYIAGGGRLHWRLHFTFTSWLCPNLGVWLH